MRAERCDALQNGSLELLILVDLTNVSGELRRGQAADNRQNLGQMRFVARREIVSEVRALARVYQPSNAALPALRDVSPDIGGSVDANSFIR